MQGLAQPLATPEPRTAPRRAGAPGALRRATVDASWLLVTEDGYDAEWLAWHLQARGVPGARFLVGGHRALTETGITGTVAADDHQFFM